jgi:hypothetical protein
MFAVAVAVAALEWAHVEYVVDTVCKVTYAMGIVLQN